MSAASSPWVFAYGSLISRPGFAFAERRVASVQGFRRRLDQGSPDHRGTPERLGRVATLVAAPGAVCVGVVYRVADGEAASVFAALDVREQGGYDRLTLPATLLDAPAGQVDAVTWVASPGNPYHLGAASLPAMAAQVLGAAGPSGRNADYVRSLDAALRALGHPDPHVAALAALLDERAR